ncbi:MAG: hypothetical protein KKA67_16405 [Spirochaetes bacterium]|nr:hypothetical protein [Spirochaetota bacterium]MBU1082382.1 hypothetical protein [Spirochaetota bacterium]
MDRRYAGRAERRALDALLALSGAWLAAGCVPEPAAAVFEPGDLRPPAVASWGPSGSAELVIAFDEDIAEAVPGFASSPGPAVSASRLGDDRRSVVVSLGGAQEPGAAYAVSGIVADAAGNLSSFVLPYWGFNPDTPGLVFNELLTEGTSTHPDAIELFATSGGNCAGLALFIGVRENYDARFVFPPLAVSAGDYVILHLKPQGIAEETDETVDRASSGGLDASAEAWDLWYRGGDAALPGKNGVASLYSSPVGIVMDAVAYSERTADSDENYGGFGTAALRDRVAALVAAGAWVASEPPRPEDCARSTGTTSTRTVCRSSSSGDADSGSDWHVAPTKGATLGRVNSDDAYSP